MRKGFTLVELLAVLTILAIISLIAIPIAINIIDSSSEKVSERSRDNYIRAVNVAIGNYNTKATEEIIDATCDIQSNGDLKCGNVLVKLNIKNNPAISGTVIIKNYNVVGYVDLKISEKTFTEISFGGTYVEPLSTDTHKGIVYMDPTDISKKCTAQAAAKNVNVYGTPTTIKTGCMKFYIYDDTGSSYKMIVDHNTSGNIPWNSNNTNTVMLEAASRLLSDTKGWIGNPRLITLDEIIEIVGYYESTGITSEEDVMWFYLDGSGDSVDWQRPTGVNATNKSRYAWLYDYTRECIRNGCNYEDSYEYIYDGSSSQRIHGYWTSTPKLGVTTEAWYVDSGLLYEDVTDSVLNGIRPFITIPKSIFE